MLLSYISSDLYEIFMELFLSRQIDQIAPVLDTCGWRCSVTPSSLFVDPHIAQLICRSSSYRKIAQV